MKGRVIHLLRKTYTVATTNSETSCSANQPRGLCKVLNLPVPASVRGDKIVLRLGGLL